MFQGAATLSFPRLATRTYVCGQSLMNSLLAIESRCLPVILRRGRRRGTELAVPYTFPLARPCGDECEHREDDRGDSTERMVSLGCLAWCRSRTGVTTALRQSVLGQRRYVVARYDMARHGLRLFNENHEGEARDGAWWCALLCVSRLQQTSLKDERHAADCN